MEENIMQIREKINQVDREMAALFERRMLLVRSVAEYKKARGLQIQDPEREKEILREHGKWLADSRLQSYYADFLQQTMRISRDYQQQLLKSPPFAQNEPKKV